MSDKSTLVMKMTINSKEFDNSLKNAKSELNKFSNQTGLASTAFKSAMKGMGSAFAGLGIAVGAKEMFSSFMHSTQEMGDKWDNTMAACKTSWQSFQTEIMLSGGAAVNQLKDMYKESKKLADLMDVYGGSQISQEYANMRYETIMSNAITQYSDAKKAGDKSGMEAAKKAANDALTEYISETNKTISDAMNAAMQHANVIGITDINNSNFWNKFDYLYNRINRGELSSDARLFSRYAAMGNREFRNEVWSRSHPTYMSGRYGVDMPYSPIARGRYAMKQAGYSEAQISAAEAEFRQSQAIDEKLKSQLDLLKNYGELNQRLDSWKRRVIQMEESGNGGGGGGISSPKSTGLSADQWNEYYSRQMQRVPLPLMPYQDLGLPSEDIIEPETDALVEAVTLKMAELVKKTQEAFVAANALGGAFSALGDLAGDNNFGKMASGMGSIINQAVATAQAMMTLAGAETVEGLAETFAKAPPLTKIALTATALAGIISMISTAKSAFAGSFADGGVVGGNSYSGDKLWARVNSGEMILPYDAWHNTGGNVKFVIEGSQLKGVLDNYQSIQSM